MALRLPGPGSIPDVAVSHGGIVTMLRLLATRGNASRFRRDRVIIRPSTDISCGAGLSFHGGSIEVSLRLMRLAVDIRCY